MPEKTGGRRGLTGHERRQALVGAAFALLTEKGFDGLRARDVAARVGVNIATLHYYFPSKQDLVQAVVDYIVQQFSAPQRPTQATPDSAPVSALRREWDDFAHDVQHRPDPFVALMELQMRARRDPAVHGLLEKMEANWRGYLENVCREDVQRGILRPDLGVTRAATLLIALMKGLTIQALNRFDGTDFASLSAEIEGWWRPSGEAPGHR